MGKMPRRRRAPAFHPYLSTVRTQRCHVTNPVVDKKGKISFATSLSSAARAPRTFVSPSFNRWKRRTDVRLGQCVLNFTTSLIDAITLRLENTVYGHLRFLHEAIAKRQKTLVSSEKKKKKKENPFFILRKKLKEEKEERLQVRKLKRRRKMKRSPVPSSPSLPLNTAAEGEPLYPRTPPHSFSEDDKDKGHI